MPLMLTSDAPRVDAHAPVPVRPRTPRQVMEENARIWRELDEGHDRPVASAPSSVVGVRPEHES